MMDRKKHIRKREECENTRIDEIEYYFISIDSKKEIPTILKGQEIDKGHQYVNKLSENNKFCNKHD